MQHFIGNGGGNKDCTHCSAVNEEVVQVHEHPPGLFGVGLLVEVSVEVAQLRTNHGHL